MRERLINAPRGSAVDAVVQRMRHAAETGENTAAEGDQCAKCYRGMAEGLAIYHRLLTTEAEIDDNVGPLNAMDQWMRRKPGDDIATYVICPCCSFEGCPDTERGHRLAELLACLRGLKVVKAMAWPLVALTTTADHPAFMPLFGMGGRLIPVAEDATCGYGNVFAGYADDGVPIIVDYIEQGSCGRPQCQPGVLWSEADCTGDPSEDPSSCRTCYPSSLIAVAA